MAESDEAKRPGKIHISVPGTDIWIDEALNMPVGMMFCVEDKETGEPVICTMTFGGVLIEEYESATTPETLHNMILLQEKNAKDMMNMMISNQEAKDAFDNLKPKANERDQDVA